MPAMTGSENPGVYMAASAFRHSLSRRLYVRSFVAGMAAALCLFNGPAQAFGPKTHAWMAERVLQDVRKDCRLEIVGRRYALRDESCAAMRNYPGFFLAGALGTDTYPDPVTAAVTLRQGVPEGWQSGEWLQRMVQQADSGPALAFALGALLQAGQDVFGNSYVNTFAGAPFSIVASPAPAESPALQRHAALEAYLDAHVPAGLPTAEDLNIPVSFLQSFLLNDSATIAQYRRVGMASHVVAMSDVRLAVQQTTLGLESLQLMAQEMLAYYSDMPLSQEALQNEFGADAQADMNAMAASKAAHEKRWSEARAAYARQEEAAKAADAVLQKLSAEKNVLAQQLSGQEKKLAHMPRQLGEENCRNVRKWINKTEWTSNLVCQSTRVKNPAWSKAKAATEKARQTLLTLEAQEKTALVNRQGMDAGLKEAELALSRLHQERLSVGNAVLVAAQPLSREQLLLRREETLRALRTAMTALDATLALSQQWQDGIDNANEAYLYAALGGSRDRLQDGGSLVGEYRKWLACSGAVYLTQKTQTLPAEKGCDEALFYADMRTHLQSLEAELQPRALQPLREVFAGLEKTELPVLQGSLDVATRELSAFVAEGAPLSRLSALLAEPQRSDRSALQALLSAKGSVQQPLLTVRNGADIIDADAGIHEGAPWRADAFHALQYADRLARMALLPPAELNRLAGRTAGMRFSSWPLFAETESRYSLLYRSLRSMEGNQQWQPYGLPYARASGMAEPENAAQRHYGYGPADGETAGLRLFINPEARRKVFNRIFPAQLSLVETHPRMQAPNYPFPSCAENPFPVTFTSAGSAAVADGSCSPRAVVQH